MYQSKQAHAIYKANQADCYCENILFKQFPDIHTAFLLQSINYIINSAIIIYLPDTNNYLFMLVIFNQHFHLAHAKDMMPVKQLGYNNNNIYCVSQGKSG